MDGVEAQAVPGGGTVAVERRADRLLRDEPLLRVANHGGSVGATAAAGAVRALEEVLPRHEPDLGAGAFLSDARDDGDVVLVGA